MDDCSIPAIPGCVIIKKIVIITITAIPAPTRIFSNRFGSGVEPAATGLFCGMVDDPD
jgi:hypothetical protein